MIRIIEGLIGDWWHLDERIEHVTTEIEMLARGNEGCRQLMTVPGIGPITASAMVAAIGNGTAFAKGRDFAAWLGLIPKQMSTGDRTILGRITKRGNRYLRTLFMQGARVILLRPANWVKHSFGSWLAAAAQRLHHNVLATALANKLAWIAWTVLVQGRSFTSETGLPDVSRYAIILEGTDGKCAEHEITVRRLYREAFTWGYVAECAFARTGVFPSSRAAIDELAR